jgi:hypothetical protein
MDWKLLLHGIAAAAVGGAIGALGQFTFTGFELDHLKALAGAALTGAITGIIAYFKTSPLSKKDEEKG